MRGKNVSENISIKFIQKTIRANIIFSMVILCRMRQTNDQIKKNAMAFHLKFNISQIIISLSESVDSRTQVEW